MEFEECHLYLRSVQFEFAPYKESAGKPPPVFITVVQEDDSLVDRLFCFTALCTCIYWPFLALFG